MTLFAARLFPIILLLVTGCATQSRDDVARWTEQQGGLIQDESRLNRAVTALNRLRLPPAAATFSVQVLNCDRPAAYAWPCGKLFVSRGLVDLLSDDELSAAVAHEAGHLEADPLPPEEMALSGHASHGDACEIAADLAGLRQLQRVGVPRSAMASMLQKVAASPLTDSTTRRLLLARATFVSK